MTHRMTNPEFIRNYCLAGEAYLTLKSLDTRRGILYRIRQVEEPRGVDSLYFVNFKYTEQFIYIGVIRNNHFEHTHKSVIEPSDVVFQVFSTFWKDLLRYNRLDPHLEVYNSGNCARCGQALTVPQDLEKGIGTCCQSYWNNLYVEHYTKRKPKGKTRGQGKLFGDLD